MVVLVADLAPAVLERATARDVHLYAVLVLSARLIIPAVLLRRRSEFA